MKTILGLGGSIHDFSACLISGNQILAVEDERITRERYAANSPYPCRPAIEYCLKAKGISLKEVDGIVANDDLKQVLDELDHPNKLLINHHLAHAYSGFFTSPFEQAAILVADGAGSLQSPEDEIQTRETTTLATGSGNSIHVHRAIYGDLSGENPITKSQTVTSNSIGEFYRAVAECLELGWLVGPGKMMGLASYGAAKNDDRFVDFMMEFIELLPHGNYRIQTNGRYGLIDQLFELRQQWHAKEDPFDVDAALANSGQIVLERLLFHVLKELESLTETSNLCLVGGVGLNSLANGKISSATRFKNVHICYSPGDSGTAVGAAIWGRMQLEDRAKTIRFKDTPFLGKSYSLEEMKAALTTSGFAFHQSEHTVEEVAELLASGKIVAWYQGESEFGPRALGNRSILADPRGADVRDHINFKVKQREWFRPLAPVVLEEDTNEYFAIDGHPSPWMQFVWPVKKQYHAILPAITHIDGTARVQSVRKDHNKRFYSLLQEFKKKTGVSVLLNTSLNVKGQPIVETPGEAIEAFRSSEIDVLVLGDFVVNK